MFPLIVGAEKVKRYVHSDYAKNNRDAVERWKKMDPKYSTGKRTLDGVCRWRAIKAGTDEEVLRREERMRNVLDAVVHCDAKSDKAITEGYEGPCIKMIHVEIANLISFLSDFGICVLPVLQPLGVQIRDRKVQFTSNLLHSKRDGFNLSCSLIFTLPATKI